MHATRILWSMSSFLLLMAALAACSSSSGEADAAVDVAVDVALDVAADIARDLQVDRPAADDAAADLLPDLPPTWHTGYVHTRPAEPSFHAVQIQDFLRAIVEGRQPLVTGEEGRKGLELMLAIYESSRTGQPVKLPLPR